MHLGNAWSALLGWLAVRRAGGSMVLRIEDLDVERCRPEYEAGLLEDLRWLGLDWDEGPYRQSERLDLYAAALADLERRGLTYPCYCTRKELRQLASAPHAGEAAGYPGTCRGLTPAQRAEREAAGRLPVTRLRCPPDAVEFEDLLRGRLRRSPVGGDMALRRADGLFAYNLAVVVDDAAMGIDLVARGDDLLEATPGQVALLGLLGAPLPRYLHVPLLVDESGVRLAKRHASLSIDALRRAGASPRTVVGWLAARAGFNPAGQPLAAAELLPRFDPALLPTTPCLVPAEEKISL